jgi:hypothetical protein
MTPTLGQDAPNTGASYLCLDAGPLINFNDADATDLLGDWLGPTAYTPEAVIELELKKRANQNAPIIGAPWLYWVPSHTDDTRLVANLLKRFGKGPPENLGEAEVVAASARYGWTAVLDDEAGRGAADDNGVPHVYTCALIAAAVAYDKLTPTKGWKLHVRIETNGGRFSPLKPDDLNKPTFVNLCNVLRRVRLERCAPDWTELLAMASPSIDDLLLDLIKRPR